MARQQLRQGCLQIGQACVFGRTTANDTEGASKNNQLEVLGVCKYKYVYTHLHIPVHLHACNYTYVYIHIYIYIIHMRVCVCINMCVYGCLYISQSPAAPPDSAPRLAQALQLLRLGAPQIDGTARTHTLFMGGFRRKEKGIYGFTPPPPLPAKKHLNASFLCGRGFL